MSDIRGRFDHIEDLIDDMESAVDEVNSWALAFEAISKNAAWVDARAVAVMALALEGVGVRLAEYWGEAFELTRSRAKPETP